MLLLRLLLTAFVLTTAPSTSRALSYSVTRLDNGRCDPKRDCVLVFVATGEIERREIQRFREFVGTLNQKAAGPRAFVIDSEGGNMAGAFGLGMVLRRIGIPVIVGSVKDGKLSPGFCGSACVFAMMGGRSRQVAPGSGVAVHAPQKVPEQGELGGEELSSANADDRGRITEILTDYARTMGVDPALIKLTMSVPPEARRTLTPGELRRYRVVRFTK